MRLAGRVDCHFFAVGLAAAEVCFHKALVLRKAAVDHRLIGTLHAVHRHLLGKADVGGVVLCHHQQAAGVLINAVDDARADLAANAGKAALAMPQQGVDQRAVRVAGCGVHHHALGLVDHQQVGILVDDVQRDILRHGLDGLCVRDLQQHGVSCLEFQTFGHSLAVALHMTLGHQRLQRRAGQAGVLAAEKAVDALPGSLLLYDKFTLFHGLLLLGGIIGMELIQKDHQHPQCHAHANTDIRKIEHGKPHEQQVDVVHYLAVEHTVDQVADTAAQHQHQCCLLQALAAAAEEQPIGHCQQRRTGGDDQEQLLAAEQAESHARIEYEPQLHHMRDERHSAYRLQNLHRPQFDQLVDADQCRHSRQIEENKCH